MEEKFGAVYAGRLRAAAAADAAEGGAGEVSQPTPTTSADEKGGVRRQVESENPYYQYYGGEEIFPARRGLGSLLRWHNTGAANRMGDL